MNTPIENVNAGPTTLTPVMRRLLNKPLLCKGRSALVMSQSKRERLARKAKELGDFSELHPWFGQIEGWQREIFRKMLFNMHNAGRGLEAERLDNVLFTVGDGLGKEVIGPILSHLYDGGTFQCHGIEISGDYPNSQQRPSIPLQQFLADHVPAGTRPARLLIVEWLLKAQARLEMLVRQRQNQDEPAEQSAVATAAQAPV
jgi:hypothetical protein